MQVTCSSASVTCSHQRRIATVSSTATKQARSQRPHQAQQWQQGGGQRQQKRAAATAAAAAEEHGLSIIPVDPSQQPSTSGQDEPDEAREFALAMAKIAWETKSEDTLVLHVAPLVYWTRYMLITTVFSRPQLNAVLGKMTKEAADVHDRRLAVNEKGISGWALLDYGDVIVHIMTADQRDYYDLEGFYGAADEVALPFDQAQAAATGADTWTKTL